MINDYENSESYRSFIDRVTGDDELFEGLKGVFSEEEELRLLKVSLECWLKSGEITQSEVIADGSTEYIEEFGLQHLVSGGWTPLQK